MHRGRLGSARPTAEWSEHALLMEATGVTAHPRRSARVSSSAPGPDGGTREPL
ncbi:MAG: hypothetical protein R3F49_00335 [Planctomycetota bacterium]